MVVRGFTGPRVESGAFLDRLDHGIVVHVPRSLWSRSSTAWIVGSRHMHYDDGGVGLQPALNREAPSAIVAIVRIVESVSMITAGAVFSRPRMHAHSVFYRP
jgi:hypothetical protein